MKSTEGRKRREAYWCRSLAALVLAAAGLGCWGAAPGVVGAVLGKDNHTGRLYVREVPQGEAAAVAGLREGDEVLSIDGVPVGQMSPEEVHRHLEGKAGAKVILLITRDGVMERVEVVRGPRLSD